MTHTPNQPWEHEDAHDKELTEGRAWLRGELDKMLDYAGRDYGMTWDEVFEAIETWLDKKAKEKQV
jgi:hypothetical protein